MTSGRRGRAGVRRLLGRAALVGGVGFAVPLVTGALGAGSPLADIGAPPATAATVACASAGGIHVALVVDLDSRVERACEAVSSGDDEAEALAVMSTALGWSAPRYASSGLLCAIDDQPSTGCGTPVGTGYAYWSSWQGTGTWTYSTGDPSTTTVASGTTIGWRFQPHGRGGPADPPPPEPSSPPKVCPGTTPGVKAPLTCASPAPASSDPPPTTSPPTSSTSTSQPSTSTSHPARSRPSTSPTSTPGDTTLPASTPASVSPGTAGSHPGSDGSGANRSGRSATRSPGGERPTAKRTPAEGAGRTGASAAQPPGATGHRGSGTGGNAKADATRPGRGRLASAPVASRSGSTGGGATPYLVVAGTLVVLAGAVVLGRRRAARTGA